MEIFDFLWGILGRFEGLGLGWVLVGWFWLLGFVGLGWFWLVLDVLVLSLIGETVCWFLYLKVGLVGFGLFWLVCFD